MALYWINVCLEVTVVVLAARRTLRRDWFSLAAYCGWDILASLLLQTPALHRFHFFIYYAWFAVSAILKLWILADVLRSFPGSDFLRARLTRFICMTALLMVAGSVIAASRHSASLTVIVPNSVETLSACIVDLWALFLVSFLFGIFSHQLGWSRRGALITNGLSLKLVIPVLVTPFYDPRRLGLPGWLLDELKLHDLTLRELLSLCVALTSVAVFSFWIRGLLVPEETWTLKTLFSKVRLETQIPVP